jgi:hypothetical protein
MLDLSTLACEQADVTPPEEGETLTRFRSLARASIDHNRRETPATIV